MESQTSAEEVSVLDHEHPAVPPAQYGGKIPSEKPLTLKAGPFLFSPPLSTRKMGKKKNNWVYPFSWSGRLSTAPSFQEATSMLLLLLSFTSSTIYLAWPTDSDRTKLKHREGFLFLIKGINQMTNISLTMSIYAELTIPGLAEHDHPCPQGNRDRWAPPPSRRSRPGTSEPPCGWERKSEEERRKRRTKQRIRSRNGGK